MSEMVTDLNIESQKRKKNYNSIIDQITSFAFVLPALIIIGIFVLYPIGKLFFLGFMDYPLLEGKGTFNGFDNFTRAFNDPLFWKSLWNSTYFSIVVVPIQTALAMFAAILVNSKLNGVKFFRTIYFFPAVTSFVAVCTLWRLLYDPSFGFVTALLNTLGFRNEGLLTQVDTAMNAIIFMCIWKAFGWFSTIFLAGLQQIPAELYESAYIDGVNVFQKFRYITFPLLKRTTMFVVVVTTMEAMRIYTPSFVMTDGGPVDSTNVITFHIWRTAFGNLEMGYASSMSLIFFIIILLITIIQFRVGKADNQGG